MSYNFGKFYQNVNDINLDKRVKVQSLDVLVQQLSIKNRIIGIIDQDAIVSINHNLYNNYPIPTAIFSIPYQSSWDVHPFNFLNPKNTTQTLADCTQGKQSCKLYVHQLDKYQIMQQDVNLGLKGNTTIVLKNFIGYQSTKLCSGQLILFLSKLHIQNQ